MNNKQHSLDNLKDIQTFLNCNGFNPGPIDGLAGSRTTNAIVSFQKTVGLTADGVVGPATKQAMRGYSSVSFTFTGSGWGHGAPNSLRSSSKARSATLLVSTAGRQCVARTQPH